MLCRDPDGGAWILLLANTLKAPIAYDLAIPEFPADVQSIAGAYGDKPLAASNGVVRVALDAFGSGIWCWGGAAPAVARSYKEFAVRPLPRRASGRTIEVVSAVAGAVPVGAYTNLQMAVDAAKDGDTIRVGEGVWEPIVSDNKLLDIVATGPRDATVIDARNKRRAATLTQKPWGDMSFQTNTLLRGFTIRGGNASADAFRPDLGGGALGGTLVDCTVSGNAASFGGGVAYANLFGCDLVKNRAVRNGGGAAHSRLVDCRVDGNQAAWDGGGLEFCAAERCVVAGNTAMRDGGGAHFGSLTSSRVVSNTAGRHGGGAIRTRSTHTLFDRNNAKAGHGGGVYAGETDFCTIVNNAAQIGGGTAASTNGGWGVGTSLKHSILRGNQARLDPATSAFHVLGGGPGTWMDVTNNLPRGVRVEDPQFVNPGAGDYRLKPSSPCVDAGGDVFVPRSTVDPDGAPRVSGGAADAGAFEMPVGGITLLDADFSAEAELVGNNPATFLFQCTGSNPVQRKDGALVFDGDAAVRMHKPLKNLGADLPAWAYHRIDCEFRSDVQGGALLALPAGKDQGFWAEIDPSSGKLRVVFTHGRPQDGNRAVFESAGRVADGAWHTLAVRTDRNGGLDAFAEVLLDGKPVPCIQSIQFQNQDCYRFPTGGNLQLGCREDAPAFHGAVKSVKASCAAF